MHKILRIIIASVLALSTIFGLHSISRYHTKVELQHIQLQDSQLKAKTLELEYDHALKQLDTNKAQSQQQLQQDEQKLKDLEQQKQQLEQQLQARAAAQQSQNVVYAAPVLNGTVVPGCGDNVYATYIYEHESGCSTYNPNRSSGACGLGQANPCSKLLAVCPSLDYACENSFFTDYANSRYGGWYGSYLFWVANHWW